MKKWSILVLVALLLGCLPLEPQKLEIEFGFGSCNKSWSWTEVKVLDDGRVKVNLTSGNKTLQKNYTFTKKQIKQLKIDVYKHNLISLNSSYINPYVIGGYCSELIIWIDDVEHRIRIANDFVPEVAMFKETLFTTLEQLDPEWYKLGEAQ